MIFFRTPDHTRTSPPRQTRLRTSQEEEVAFCKVIAFDAKALEEFLKSGYGRKQMKEFLKLTIESF